MAKDKNGRELPQGIRQRGNGAYEGRIMYEYKNYTVYGKTVTEVKKQMTDLRYKLEHGVFVSKSKVTFADWFMEWMDIYKRGSVKKGTSISYSNYFDYYIREELGNKRLTDIRGEHIQRLYNKLEENGLKASSMKVLKAILNGCFKQAVKNGIIEKNPVELATLPRAKPKEERRVLTREEQKIFMDYAKDSYLYNLFDLTLRTGMRNGEVRGLKNMDIDRKQAVIHIVRTLKYESGMGFFEDTPKTPTSKRDIPLTEDIINILDRQKKSYVVDDIIKLDDYLFRLEDGKPISRERVQLEIDRIVKEINHDGISFERFTPHCFRHTFATRAIENGMTPQTLKTILGHSSLAMTMDLYSHVLPSTKAEEMKMIAKGF